jgi:hypothetical protein
MEKTVITKRPWIVVAMVSLGAISSLLPLAAVAQVAAEPPPAAQPAPMVTPAPAPEPAPAPAPMMTPAPEPMAPPPPVVAVPEDVPPPPPPVFDDASKKPININLWGRVGTRLQGINNPKKLDHLTMDGDLELHFDGQATNEIGVTGNVAATFGPPPTAFGGPQGADIQGTVQILDLIARFDLTDAFHIWGGRMLVPSDRANFSGTWFEAPWYYPGMFSPNGPMGPMEGPYGRNDGMTIWGQAAGGLFKYYVSAFDLWDPNSKPLWSGRLNLSLINPEPGYYHSSTYYGGKDLLAIGIGGQYKKDGSTFTPMTTMGMAGPTSVDDYALFNADILFEKNLKESGVIDIEGAVYKYFGDFNPYKLSWLALASWMTPDKVGPGKIQPLIRFQQGKQQDNRGGGTDSSLEAQIGYVIADYNARLALGYQYTKIGVSNQKGNAIYLGVQVLK